MQMGILPVRLPTRILWGVRYTVGVEYLLPTDVRCIKRHGVVQDIQRAGGHRHSCDQVLEQRQHRTTERVLLGCATTD